MNPDTATDTATDPVRVCLDTIGRVFADVFAEVQLWRETIEATAAGLSGAGIDAVVASFAIPALNRPESMLIGAGFVGRSADTAAEPLHFAWWLGPTSANPLLPESTTPSRLDVATRSYTDYLSDFTSLEWYRVPESTRRAHVTGPYVDYLCICDYILTVTMPVQAGGTMIGVVGADIYVRRLEKAVLPAMLALRRDAALLNEAGRVVVSTDLALPVGGILAPEGDGIRRRTTACPGTPFRLTVRA